MTSTSRTNFITIASAAALASIALFSQGASAATANTNYSASQAQMLKYCARLTGKDVTGCREKFARRKYTIELLKENDGGGGRGGRGNGRK